MFAFATRIVPACAMGGKFSRESLSDPQTIFAERADRATIEVHRFQPLPTDARPHWTLRTTLPVGQASHEKPKLWCK
jgi:hypothetical protein